MPCGCQKNAPSTTARPKFLVVTQSGAGKQVYDSFSKDNAVGVSRRYPSSVVKNGSTGEIVHRADPPNPPPAAPAAPAGKAGL